MPEMWRDRQAHLVERIRDLEVTDIVVWGLKSNTHSHHYIHRAIYLAFKAVAAAAKVRIHWYDDQPVALPASRWMRTARSYLFFASPHYDADRHIPLLDDARYILHADWSRSWPAKRPITEYTDHARAERAVYWRVFRGLPSVEDGYVPIARDELTFFNAADRRLVMPWATDLAPDEATAPINSVIDRFRRERLFPGNRALYVGSVWSRNEETMRRFDAACASHGLELIVERIDGLVELIAATQNAFMAPAIQGEGHRRSDTEFYVPCRIFKNISYGALGVTNNAGVDDLFDHRLIFAEDEDEIVRLYKESVAGFRDSALGEMVSLMEHVRDHHTYINRLATCLDHLI